VGKDLVDLGFLKDQIANEITTVLMRRDQLHHQVSMIKQSFHSSITLFCACLIFIKNEKIY
jgi:hypothetical protein